MWDTLSKMTLLHFLAIQLTEPNPTETLYWARNGHFWSLILGEGRSAMLVLLVLTLSGSTWVASSRPPHAISQVLDSKKKNMCCRIWEPENV